MARLGQVEPGWVKEYPKFKDPSEELAPGTSLCRLGYPFSQLETSFDEEAAAFRFDPEGRLAIFPIEGILTREIHALEDGKRVPLFIETSSPGLMGQSGGPIIDTSGVVWGIQSRTLHLSLRFNPPVPGDESGKKEHQFLNVGVGTHPARIIELLDQQGIKYGLFK